MHFNALKLDDRLLRAVDAAGYTETTPVQEAAIPAGLEGRDLICTAQTGTGKTAAFVLPILQSLLQTKGKRGHVRAVIVTPTRELAEQIHAAIRQLGQFTWIRSATVYGGVAMAPQERALRKGADIIVACPGRLIDHLQRGNADLRDVETLVLDEADRMLDMGFMPQVRQIVERIPRDRQTLFFSATFAPELNQLASEVLRNPARVEIGIAAPACTITHTLCPVANECKTDLLLQLLRQSDIESVLIFTRTKHRADRVAAQLGRAGFRAEALHSNKSQNQRQRTLDGFRSGKFQLLAATDMAARGLDIERVSHVINYDVPDTPDAYIHRVGRTGRAERSGDALTLVTADDRSTIRDIERALGEPIEVRKVEGFDYGNPSFRAGKSSGGGRTQPTPTSYSSRNDRRMQYGSRKSSASRRSGR
jgi:ATP-dependent RNA helicase RhlE